jgi:hypothetical protein
MPVMCKYSKCFEGHGPILAFAANAPDQTGHFRKFYLIIDANQQSFGISSAPERFEEVKSTGSVVAIMRKHAKSGTIAGIFRESETGDYWLPMFTSRGEHPDFWLQLAVASPPELRFIDASGTALVRKSSQGTYTKRWQLNKPLPTYPVQVNALMEDISASLIEASSPAEADLGQENALTATSADTSTSTNPALLPDYQRSARDRIARRLKTVRKAMTKAQNLSTHNTAALAAEHEAQLLQNFLSRVLPGQDCLEISAEESGFASPLIIELNPDRTPGQNLSDLFTRAKKARRGASLLEEQVAEAEAEVQSLTLDLESLRAGTLNVAAVNEILRRHQLQTSKGGGVAPAAGEKVPYRIFEWRPVGAPPKSAAIRLLVGKSAADSDELCRQAKGNDLWLHVVGSTGSHVIIPARDLKAPPLPGLIRTAAILAVHFSKLRADQSAEVYLTRRQNIKKRKGMAPGLWQVNQAETLFCRYETEELQSVLVTGL